MISRKFAYADDLALLHSSGNWKDLEGTLSQDMSTLWAYLQTWRLKLSPTKTVTTAFHLNNREAKRELKVYNNGGLLPFCPTPTYLGVKLDRSLTFRHHLVALRKKLSSRVTLLRRLVGSGWGAGAKTLRIATLSLVYSTAEYCAPVWCRSAHTRLIDSVLNDALRIVTGCLRPTPTDHLSILSGIQPAELRRMGATLSLAHRGSLDPDHILHGLLSGSSDTRQVRLRSRRPFVAAARNLLDNFARLGIRASEWTNLKWKTEYCEGASRLRAFVLRTGARPVGMGLPRAAWVKLNRLRTAVGRFHSSMHKWGLAPSPNCECGASEQTADHVLKRALYIGHHMEHEVWRFWMTKLDAGLMTSLPASDPGSAAVWGSKRINPRPQSCLCLTWSGYLFKRRRRRPWFREKSHEKSETDLKKGLFL